MKKNYNGLNIELGSIVDANPKIQQNISSHFTLFNDDPNNNTWYNRFNCEYKEMNNFYELTKDKNTLLDVGCQFGSFSLSFIGKDKNKQSYAIDGGDNPFLVLSQIKLLNKLHNLNVFNFLIGNKDQKVQCYSEELQSLALGGGNDVKLMLKIDTLCGLYDIKPDVIKIDIEGAEFEALLGAYSAILKYKPIIFIEIHPKFLYNYNSSIQNIVEFVNLINYKVLDLNQNEVTNYLEILQQEETDSNRTIWIPK